MAKNPINVLNDEQEYRQVRKDLTFVVIMNLCFLALLVGMYLVNRSSGRVDQFFARLLKF